MSRHVVVGRKVYRLILAQDPEEEEAVPDVPPDETGEEMVEQLRKSPADNWRKFLQPIIINVRNAFGLDIGQVSLVGPRILNKFTSPQYGFSITGHIRFEPDIPDEVIREHGQPPYRFEAAVTPKGELISSVKIVGSEG